jgi:hypothetical protein
MPNTFITPTVVANEFLMQLESALVMGNLVHRGFSKEFVKVGDTITVKRPATFTAEAVQSGMSVQGVTESSISLKIDKRRGVLVTYTAEDAAMKISDFNAQITIPAVRAIAENVDTDLMALAHNIPYVREQSATAVLADLALLSADLSARKVPTSQRALVLDPMSYAKYMSIEAIASLAARGNTDAVANGLFDRAMGFDIGMSQQVATEGTIGSGVLTNLTTAATGALGIEVMTTIGTTGTLAGLIPAGTTFKIAGDSQVYAVTANATQIVGTGCVIHFSPGLQVAISTAQAITLEAVVTSAKTESLAFHKNAIALVTVPEAPSQSCPSKVLFSNGLNVMLTYERDTTNHIDTMLFEILYGVKVLDPRMAERFVSD